MTKILLVFTILLSSLAHAGDYSDYYSYCVLNKNGKFEYKVDKVGEFVRGMYTPSSGFDDSAHHAVARTIRGSARLYDEARNILSVLGRGEFVKGKNIRSWTISSLKQQIRLHSMNDFEKASLVTCAVFMLIDYKDNLSTKLGSIIEIYEKGQGICTEMTDIARDLGDAVGLEVRSMVSDEDHNWPEYKIDGGWYILDPTASNFHFMESLKR
ncbi:MAG TPA: transglutaminase domain-containing protein [Bacteriovoracaceae bacterium]|nr:transglutaminase domain-containing protein [Bacteriovoracaceae bacterium]